MKANYLYILIFIILLILPSFSLIIEDEDEENEREYIIYLKSKINKIYATTEITQYFFNHLDNPIEFIISFPLIEEISINKFIIKIWEKTVNSKVMEKEKVEEKYDESIYSGNSGFLGRYDNTEMKSYSINIGNVIQKKKLTLKTYFIQNIGALDMSYEFIIIGKYSTFHSKELKQEEQETKK